jgi:hypothetical protein
MMNSGHWTETRVLCVLPSSDMQANMTVSRSLVPAGAHEKIQKIILVPRERCNLERGRGRILQSSGCVITCDQVVAQVAPIIKLLSRIQCPVAGGCPVCARLHI